MRLIRSKGVGVYFCSQNPVTPDSVPGQLGNRPARAACLYTARPESRARRRRDVCQQPESGCRQSHHRARGRRSTGLDTAGQGHPDAGTTRPDCAAALPHGRNHTGRAGYAAPAQSGGRQIRHGDQSRIRLRNAGCARKQQRVQRHHPCLLPVRPPHQQAQQNPIRSPRNSASGCSAPVADKVQWKRWRNRRCVRQAINWARNCCAACWAA